MTKRASAVAIDAPIMSTSMETLDVISVAVWRGSRAKNEHTERKRILVLEQAG